MPDIARTVGLIGDDDQLVKALCEKIDSYNVRLNIPKTLKEFGVNEEEFLQKLPSVAELAVGDACTGSNPAPSPRLRWPTCSSAAITARRSTSKDSDYGIFPHQHKKPGIGQFQCLAFLPERNQDVAAS